MDIANLDFFDECNVPSNLKGLSPTIDALVRGKKPKTDMLELMDFVS